MDQHKLEGWRFVSTMPGEQFVVIYSDPKTLQWLAPNWVASKEVVRDDMELTF